MTQAIPYQGVRPLQSEKETRRARPRARARTKSGGRGRRPPVPTHGPSSDDDEYGPIAPRRSKGRRVNLVSEEGPPPSTSADVGEDVQRRYVNILLLNFDT